MNLRSIIATGTRGPGLRLTLKDIHLALARSVPNPGGGPTLVANPYRTWREVNAAWPDLPIRVFGPPPTSGTRDVVAELAMEGGCRSYGWLAATRRRDPEGFGTACHAIREDGAYIDSGENDNLIIKKLEADETAVGIFGFSFYDQNTDKVKAAEVNGVAPTWETIFEHVYPLSRPLYLYVKKAHIGWIPGSASSCWSSLMKGPRARKDTSPTGASYRCPGKSATLTQPGCGRWTDPVARQGRAPKRYEPPTAVALIPRSYVRCISARVTL